MLEIITNHPRFVLALGVALVATVTDFHSRTIYDYLTIPAIVVGIGLNVYLSLPITSESILPILGLPALAFVIGYGLNYIGWWGGGDVKLVTAVVSCLPAYVIQMIIFPFFVLIPVALVRAGIEHKRSNFTDQQDFTDREVEMPSAPFFLIALIISLFVKTLVI